MLSLGMRKTDDGTKRDKVVQIEVFLASLLP